MGAFKTTGDIARLAERRRVGQDMRANLATLVRGAAELLARYDAHQREYTGAGDVMIAADLAREIGLTLPTGRGDDVIDADLAQLARVLTRMTQFD